VPFDQQFSVMSVDFIEVDPDDLFSDRGIEQGMLCCSYDVGTLCFRSSIEEWLAG
jgi:hypothetical protein